MNEGQERLVRLCEEFVRSLVRLEEGIRATTEALSRTERREALGTVLTWVTTTDELPATSFTRELAREILGQLSALAVYDDYEGTTDGYIG